MTKKNNDKLARAPHKQDKKRGNKKWRGKNNWAQSIGQLVPDLTKTAFEKFGFPAAALLNDWEAIVGSHMAGFTEAERIKWPPRPQTAHEENTNHKPSKQRHEGAQLLIRVEGPGALEIQHQSDQIVERINSYFGFRAIASLRFVQAPLRRTLDPKKSRLKKLHKKLDPLPPPVSLKVKDNEQLEAALTKMWQGIQAKQQD